MQGHTLCKALSFQCAAYIDASSHKQSVVRATSLYIYIYIRIYIYVYVYISYVCIYRSNKMNRKARVWKDFLSRASKEVKKAPTDSRIIQKFEIAILASFKIVFE